MRLLFDQFRFNVAKGPLYEEADSIPGLPSEKNPVRLIAYYLPQFHSIRENDGWWGPGFTEWTNVVKSLPHYVGHKQPRLPADFGFYDLSRFDAIRRQAELAKRAGIYGFCIHDYWFSGHKVLERPLQIILENPRLDIKFCLNWANESWSRRWESSESDILLKQRYDEGDDVRYAESILPAVMDPRYIRVDGRPLIMFYRPRHAPDARGTVNAWRNYFKRKGAGDPYVVMAQVFDEVDPRPYGMDAAAGFPPHGGWALPNERDRLKLLDYSFRGHIVSYDLLAERMLERTTADYRVFPGVCPDWDNNARKPGRGYGLYGSTPAKYGSWLKAASEQIIGAPRSDERIVFINAWNEWAEGAYLEPDQHHGYAYLAETRRVLDGLAGCSSGTEVSQHPAKSKRRLTARPAIYRKPFNRARRIILSLTTSKRG
jgi:hypothetical protein